MSDVTSRAAGFLRVLVLASVIVFAITGALAASRKQRDIVGHVDGRESIEGKAIPCGRASRVRAGPL
jgi:hypothetical protein